MFWKKVVLDGFVPFTHSGISHVEIDFESPATAILAGNGVGKSSLLRELSVFPAVRTSYLKSGKIQKIIEHGGHLFELTSDFSNATAPHSFKKDGEELNLSGTTETQKDLVEENFGINSLIEDLMAGNIHICDMQKSLRKQLFSATYPSDLSFVLEYHKKVCTQIRTFANQIKLLQGREGSLISSLLTTSEEAYSHDYREGMLYITSQIDKVNLLLENEVQRLSDHELFKKEFVTEDLDEIKNQLDHLLHQLRNSLIDVRKSHNVGESLNVQDLTTKEASIGQKVNYFNDKKNLICTNLQSIRDELDKFIRLRNAPKADKKAEIANELELVRKELEELKSSPDWQNYPAIVETKMSEVNDLIPTFNELIASIHPYSGKIMGNDQIVKINSENDAITFTNSSLLQEKCGIDHQLCQLRSRKEMMTQNSYPKDCSRVCGLRATLEASVRDIDLHITDLEGRLNKIDEDLKANIAIIDKNKQILVESAPALQPMKTLWEKLSENYLVDLALDGESYLECMNTHPTEITNRILKGLKSSKVYYRYKELYDKSTSLENTLTMMESNESVNLSLEVIDSIVSEKQTQLDKGILELDDLEKRLKEIQDSVYDVTEVKYCIEMIDKLIQLAQDVANKEILQTRIDFDRQVIAEHEKIRNEVGANLRKIEAKLEEQKRIEYVLNTEIRPTLEGLRKQKMDWELVELGLSPTKGLPCIYLIRFINRLIARANAFINEIWFCDMELAYLEEKDNLDYTLSLILNKSSLVKDISLCSNGQKAVIDLAFTLAIAMERGYLNSYPMKMDETDAALTEEHRTKLVDAISRMLDNQTIRQLFIVNHFAIQTGLPNCDSVALSTDGIVIPGEYNLHAVIS